MKRSKAIERFKRLYMFGSVILGATPEEQNTMFLYMFTEILRIAAKNVYKIKQDTYQYRYDYRVDLEDYGYKVVLYIYTNTSTHKAEHMYISLQKNKYERSLRIADCTVKAVTKAMWTYVTKHKQLYAYLILNGININNLIGEMY